MRGHVRIRGYESPFSSSDVAEIMPRIERALLSGKLTLGEHVASLEREFAALTGAGHAVASSSGTGALVTAMRALSDSTWLNGGEVLVPAHTFFAVPAAVILAGGRVRFTDVSMSSIAPSLSQIKASITPATVGVILVHMGGVVSPETEAVVKWLAKQGVWTVEDSSHAHGCRLGGVHAGTFADMGVFSMFATKVLTCGEGGLLVTNREALSERARMLLNLGRRSSWGADHREIGTSGRLSEMGAILGRQMIGSSTTIFAHRQRIARAYDTWFSTHCDSPIVPIVPSNESTYYKYVALLPPGVDRARVKRMLDDDGIQLGGEIYVRTLQHHEILRRHGEVGASYPIAEEFADRHICLPIHRKMSAADAAWVAERLALAVRSIVTSDAVR